MQEEDYEFEEYAKLIKAIGDVNRIKILNLLSVTEKTVNEIKEELNLSQPLISHHLKYLKYEGLVTSRKDGVCVYYSLISPAITNLINCILVCCKQVVNFKKGKIETIKSNCEVCKE